MLKFRGGDKTILSESDGGEGFSQDKLAFPFTGDIDGRMVHCVLF